MPELPEVETVVRDLRPLLVGRKINAVRASKHKLRSPWKAAWNAQVTGQTVDRVERRGKWIVLDLRDGKRLVLHLGMTGQLTVVDAAQPRQDHVHLIFGLDGEKELRFRDSRRFGSARVFPDQEALEEFFEANKLGPEPFGLDPTAWRDALARTARNLKAVLLDQRVVAGVGNIYADESLFVARLHPGRQGKELTAAEATRLRKAIAEVLEQAIASRGSTIRDYVDGSGEAGGYQNSHRVYDRAGEPCPRCGVVIEVLRIAGRSSHFCPSCQPRGD